MRNKNQLPTVTEMVCNGRYFGFAHSRCINDCTRPHCAASFTALDYIGEHDDAKWSAFSAARFDRPNITGTRALMVLPVAVAICNCCKNSIANQFLLSCK
jgi:hypothetical protein